MNATIEPISVSLTAGQWGVVAGVLRQMTNELLRRAIPGEPLDIDHSRIVEVERAIERQVIAEASRRDEARAKGAA